MPQSSPPLLRPHADYGSLPPAPAALSPGSSLASITIEGALGSDQDGINGLTEESGERVPLLAGLSRPAKCRHGSFEEAQPKALGSSFYGLPRSWSSVSLRSSLGWMPGEDDELDWISLAVVYWVIFVSEASRGLIMPSKWPYVRSLGGSKAMLGLAVASLSFGRICSTVPLGHLSDRWSVRRVLMGATVLQMVGHVVYALAPTLGILIAARVVVGFGSATMSVCRLHVARAVSPRNRTHHFAYISALQFVGYAVLPGAGGVLALLPEARPLPFLRFNGFTYPGWALFVCNIVAFLAIYMMYLDAPHSPRAPVAPPPPPPPTAAPAAAPPPSASTRPDALALFVCLLINLAFRGTVAQLETIATPFLMDLYGLTFGQASYYLSLLGLLGLAVYLSFKPLARRFRDRSLVLFGLFALVLGAAPLVLPLRLPLALYVALLATVWSVAYPVGQTAVLALFSKALAALPAGGLLGLFSATGSLARVLFAVLAARVWAQFGQQAVYLAIVAYALLTLVLALAAYRRLAPPEL